MNARAAAIRIAQERAKAEGKTYHVWSAIRDSKIVYAVLPQGEKPRTHIACVVQSVASDGALVSSL